MNVDYPELRDVNVVVAAPAWSLNGPNVFAAQLVRGLQVAGIEAHVLLTRHDWSDVKPMPMAAGVPTRMQPVSRFASLRTRWRTMVRYLEALAPCIYIPNYDFSHSCISPKLSQDVSIVGIVHSDDPQHYDHAARLGRYWDAIVAVSDAIAVQTRGLDAAFESRVSVIPYGVDIPDQPPARKPEGDGTLRIVYAGRLMQHQKRILDMPSIIRALIDDGIPAELTLVGGGTDRTRLAQACADLGVQDRVTFAGTLANSEVAAVLARHDVFVLTSEFEGLPVSLLEAMGRGCVPVVTDIRSGIPEVVTDGVNGFRVPVGDVGQFAARLSALQRDAALRYELGLNAYRTVSDGGYRIRDMIENYLALFRHVRVQSQRSGYTRPPGSIVVPSSLRWQERLPGVAQMLGHYGRRLLTGGRD